MKKRKLKTASAILAALIVSSSAVPIFAYAENEDNNKNQQIHIVVENTTCTKADGAAWEGVLIDKWVDIDSDSTLADEFIELLSAEGYTQTGVESDYVTEIGGLSANDCGSMSGWMVTLDNWVGNAVSSYTVSSGTLDDGDEFIFKYSSNWGADIGYDWSGTSTKLSALEIGSAEFSPEFSSDVTEYIVSLPENTESIRVIPTAENNAFRTKIYKNEYTPEDKTEYKMSRDIDVFDGDVIYVGVGYKDWQYTADGVEETVYKVTLNIPSANENSEISEISEISEVSEISENSEVSEISQESIADEESNTEKDNSTDISIDEIISGIKNSFNKNENRASVGNEWQIISAARLGFLSDEDKAEYIKSVKEYIDQIGNQKLDTTRSTDNSKFVIALTAVGCDASNFYGYDLTEPLSDLEYDSKQGINGSIYALIALGSHNYTTKSINEGTRKALIENILSAQLPDGGWTFFGDVSDPDMTSMALYALSQYYSTDEDVKAAVDKAIDALSKIQSENGAFASFGTEGCDSSAQVIIALTSLNIDPSKDERFIKNGNSAVDAFKRYYLPDDGAFSYRLGENANAYSTQQAYLAVAAYSLLENGKNSLYNMNDISFNKNSEVSNENNNSSIDSDSSVNSNSNTTNSNISNTSNVSNTTNTTNTTISGNNISNSNANTNNSNTNGNTNSGNSNGNSNGSSNENTVSTGDNFSLNVIFMLIAGSAVTIFAAAKKKMIKK